jgi:hypothetical protein
MFFVGYIQRNSLVTRNYQLVTTYLLLAQTLNGFRFGEPHTNRSPLF